jgi:hypothetical protein
MSTDMSAMIAAFKAAKMSPEEIGRACAAAMVATDGAAAVKHHGGGSKPASGGAGTGTTSKPHTGGGSKPASGGAGTGTASDGPKKPTDADREKVKEAIDGIFDKATNVTELSKLTISGTPVLYIKKWQEKGKPLNLVLSLNRKMIDMLKKELEVDPLAVIFALNNYLKEHVEEHVDEVLADLKSNWTDAYPVSILEGASGLELVRNKAAGGFDILLTK